MSLKGRKGEGRGRKEGIIGFIDSCENRDDSMGFQSPQGPFAQKATNLASRESQQTREKAFEQSQFLRNLFDTDSISIATQ